MSWPDLLLIAVAVVIICIIYAAGRLFALQQEGCREVAKLADENARLREALEKEPLIERNAALRRAFKEASQELYLCSAQYSGLKQGYLAECASEAADAARKAAEK